MTKKLHSLILDLRAKLYDCHKLMQDIDNEQKKLEDKGKSMESNNDIHKNKEVLK